MKIYENEKFSSTYHLRDRCFLVASEEEKACFRGQKKMKKKASNRIHYTKIYSSLDLCFRKAIDFLIFAAVFNFISLVQ